MSKAKSVYSCTECGGTSPKWQGQCPGCGQWNTLVESAAEAVGEGGNRFGRRFNSLAASTGVQCLSEVAARETPRQQTGIAEFDRVLGGGLVAGGVVLIGGDPGIGKSTLLLQALSRLNESGVRCLYVTGEESAEQVALRAKRLQVPTEGLRLLAEISLEKIVATAAKESPSVLVVDSIQTVYTDALQSAPGSVAQVRECGAQLTRLAKQTGITVLLVGHSTKEGTLAGPRTLEHMVDCVCYFEGDGNSSYRLIRASKNRYGSVNEIGIFAMLDTGLKGVSNPSAMFLSGHTQDVPGSCVFATQEGTRPLLVEIQALVDESHTPNPRRLSVGLDQNRLAMLLAVMHRHCGVVCYDQDVFVNAVGGLRITEPAADLPILLAVLSSIRSHPLRSKLITFGEIGLAGEIRPAPRGQERLHEAAKLGFDVALVPRANMPKKAISGIEITAIDRVDQVLEFLR